MLVKRLRQRGDTIVEVMIVLAVLGSAIGISYTTANRSLLNARQAQENAEAARIAQTQVEALYTPSIITDPADSHFIYIPSGRAFCMDNNDGDPPIKFSAASDGVAQKDINYIDFPQPSADPVKNCVQGLYHYSIRYDAAQNNKFTVVVVWDDVLGQGKDTVTLTYRIYPPVQRDDI
jgi:type II secretory pathway pseudopilin PulG